MRLRDSGMPAEEYWESLFDVDLILRSLGIDRALRDVAELGCGYGTFTIPTAQRVSGQVLAFDIEPAMVARTLERATAAGLDNVVCQQRDVMERGFGLPANSVDAVLLFNILHCENPLALLHHATDVVRPDGWLLVIHWRCDPATPRGPSLDTRPTPQQIIAWAGQTGRLCVQNDVIDLPPWHFGLRLKRLSSTLPCAESS